jgi:Flp pilus assembly protein TadG
VLTRFRSGRARGRQRGQSLAEFALVAPIFFLLVFSVIQMGLIFGTQNGLVNGVREAARRAATYRINEGSFDTTVWGSICSTIETELLQLGDRIIPGYVQARLAPTVSYAWTPNPETNEYSLVAEVSATYAHPLYVPLVSVFFDGTDGSVDGSLRLTATEQMRVENPALEYTGTPPTIPACP